ncbi:MAG: prepilin-type N-terminal cleavage/methylation domain-containing protein [Woeseiaceae bacterium]|nr:prepilin-type N-terminal cleavage/methylation domain-containing protein [Woeseiaceae bacterium]
MTCREQRGLTLVEVLVATALLAVMLVPAINALTTSSHGAEVHRELASNRFRLTSRLEDLLAEPFADLQAAAIAAGSPQTATTYSEPAGVPGRIVVYLAACDGDNADGDGNLFTGTDTGLLWIRVAAENTVHDLQTVRAQGF